MEQVVSSYQAISSRRETSCIISLPVYPITHEIVKISPTEFQNLHYDRQIEQNYQRYPTTQELLKQRTASCPIGSNFTSEHDDYSLVMEYMQKTLPTFTPSREDIPFYMYITETMKNDGYYLLDGTGNIEDRSGGGSYEVGLRVMIHKMYKDVFITWLERQQEIDQEPELQEPELEIEL